MSWMLQFSQELDRMNLKVDSFSRVLDPEQPEMHASTLFSPEHHVFFFFFNNKSLSPVTTDFKCLYP